MADTGLITLSRRIKAAPSRVYDVLVSSEARQIWGPPDAGSVVIIDGQPDPAPGVREASRCGPTDNPYVDVTTDWILMQPDERLVYSELLAADGDPLGVSQATMELAGADGATTLDVTIQITSFIGAEMLGEFESGWGHALENLARHAEGHHDG